MSSSTFYDSSLILISSYCRFYKFYYSSCCLLSTLGGDIVLSIGIEFKHRLSSPRLSPLNMIESDDILYLSPMNCFFDSMLVYFDSMLQTNAFAFLIASNTSLISLACWLPEALWISPTSFTIDFIIKVCCYAKRLSLFSIYLIASS